jgi:hypothetical protein
MVLLLNEALYGNPFATGYGRIEGLFSLAAVPENATNYAAWLIETHTPFPVVALVSPFVVPSERRAEVLLALGLVAANCVIYFLYTPFDDWSYLRFLLPAIALLTVLAAGVLARLAERRYVLIAAAAGVIGMFCVRAADDRLAFALQSLEQRYRSAGIVVRDRLPADAVVLAVWDSGAVRFHGRKEAIAWESLDPVWLDRSLEWLESQGHTPYILTESWEEQKFRDRFEEFSVTGRLDWPPKYEIDRVVRIFDPKDRARYEHGERIDTQYLWPLRKN